MNERQIPLAAQRDEAAVEMLRAQGACEISVVKVAENQGPVPSAWRSILTEIIASFVRKDYRLSIGIPGVAPVSAETAEQIQNYIESYGATLIDLPESTWNTSVCIWVGDRWDVLIDLSTQEEGSSDLVLQAHILETNGSYVIHVYIVYVP